MSFSNHWYGCWNPSFRSQLNSVDCPLLETLSPTDSYLPHWLLFHRMLCCLFFFNFQFLNIEMFQGPVLTSFYFFRYSYANGPKVYIWILIHIHSPWDTRLTCLNVYPVSLTLWLSNRQSKSNINKVKLLIFLPCWSSSGFFYLTIESHYPILHWGP